MCSTAVGGRQSPPGATQNTTAACSDARPRQHCCISYCTDRSWVGVGGEKEGGFLKEILEMAGAGICKRSTLDRQEQAEVTDLQTG